MFGFITLKIFAKNLNILTSLNRFYFNRKLRKSKNSWKSNTILLCLSTNLELQYANNQVVHQALSKNSFALYFYH